MLSNFAVLLQHTLQAVYKFKVSLLSRLNNSELYKNKQRELNKTLLNSNSNN